MVEIERENVCPLACCPAPNDPDWHVCAVCGALAIEHDHTRGRGRLTLDKGEEGAVADDIAFE